MAGRGWAQLSVRVVLPAKQVESRPRRGNALPVGRGAKSAELARRKTGAYFVYCLWHHWCVR